MVRSVQKMFYSCLKLDKEVINIQNNQCPITINHLVTNLITMFENQTKLIPIFNIIKPRIKIS